MNQLLRVRRAPYRIYGGTTRYITVAEHSGINVGDEVYQYLKDDVLCIVPKGKSPPGEDWILLREKPYKVVRRRAKMVALNPAFDADKGDSIEQLRDLAGRIYLRKIK